MATGNIPISSLEFEQNPRAVLERVRAGESGLVALHDGVVAESRPLASHPHRIRPFGLAHGEFSTPADFDASLPDSVLREFEGL
jgi:antitoxin (DNA-binding transcriptional repressor) of toxin-antitoxin stability system